MSARAMFAAVLRGYRVQNGLTQEQTAPQLQVSLSTYKKVEQQQLRAQRDFAAGCDRLFKAPGVFVILQEAVVAEPYPDWFGPRVTLEDRASVIHEWEMRGVPGLLQTEAYARAACSAGKPYDSPDAIERNMRSRLERQDILTRDNPPKLWIVIAEGALRQVVGSPDVMHEQLDHLIKVSESQHVVLQVLPFSASGAPSANGPAALFEFDDGPPVAYLEGWETGRVVENPKDVAEVATGLTMIKSCALSPMDSRQFMIAIRG